jgi:hypothetical protein
MLPARFVIRSVAARCVAARCVTLCCAALMLGGCGGTLYAVRAGKVSSELELAQRDGAAESAPYEYYFAEAQLSKARSEAAEADYGDALSLLDEAEVYTQRARDRDAAPASDAATIGTPTSSRWIPSEVARLERLALAAEQSGARRCAPRELAVGRSQLAFATIEDAQGFAAKARQHLRLAEQNVQAARLLSIPPRCAGARTP